MRRNVLARIAVPALAALACGCSIVRVDSSGDPPRIESKGVLKGHAALGFSDEGHLLHLDLFGGSSRGAIAEIAVWKLLRVEVGLAGASLGVGPIHLGLGVFFYKPKVPQMVQGSGADESASGDTIELEYEQLPAPAESGG